MIRLAFLTLLGLLTGGIVHVLSLLMIPALATQDAYGRLENVTSANGFRPLPKSAAGEAVPFLDPAFSYRFCRYDLLDGPIRIRTDVMQTYVSLSFYARDSVAFFAINDRSAVDGKLDVLLYTTDMPPPELENGQLPPSTIALPAPTATGLIVLRALPASDARRETVERVLDRAQCLPQLDAGSRGGAGE